MPLSLMIPEGFTPEEFKRRGSAFKKKATTDIIAKSWEAYTDGEGQTTPRSTSAGSEDSVSVSSLQFSESSVEIAPSRRRIRSFKILALSVRLFISLLPRSYFDSQVIYEDQPGEKIVKAGTLEAIITYLTPAESPDPRHLRDFLLTYRYYTTPENVLNILINRFKENLAPIVPNQPAIVSLRVINLIRKWLKEFSYDFEEEENALEIIRNFITNDVATHSEQTVSRWADPLRKAMRDLGSPKLSPAGPPGLLRRASSLPVDVAAGFTVFEEALSSEDLTGAKHSFTTINPVDIFRQLTIMEVDLFRSITPRDMFLKTVKKRIDKCPNLMRMIAQFNNTSFWVAKEICICQNLKQRTELLKRFIHIAQLCYDWKNFNTCLEVVGGLSMTCVQRLKKTWKGLPSKFESMWRELQALMAPTQNYIAYRNYFKNVERPALPYFGLFLSDLCLIQEKYPTKLAGEKINFAKMRMLAHVLIEMQNYQSTLTYPFGENLLVQSFIDDANVNLMDEEELYACSKLCEGTEEPVTSRMNRFTLRSPRRSTLTLSESSPLEGVFPSSPRHSFS